MSELRRLRQSEGYGACDDEVYGTWLRTNLKKGAKIKVSQFKDYSELLLRRYLQK